MKNKQQFTKGWNTLSFTFLLMCFSFRLLAADATDKKITLSFSNLPLKEAIRKVEAASGYTFFYDEHKTDLNQKVSLSASNLPLEDALEAMLKTTRLGFEITNRQIALFPRDAAPSATRGTPHIVTGTVRDALGDPVIGANVVVKGTTNGTITDIDGHFSIEAASHDILQVSFIGYLAQDIALGGKKEIAITIREDTQKLDEVVVVGYGTQKKVNLTGAVEQVTSEVFDNRSISNVTQALQGTIPNLNISMSDGKPTRTAEYNIRGTTSIGQKGSALVLIDGVEGDPSMLNPNDIASISVLKDAASAAIYGARGAFGVVLISTKNPSKDKTSVTYTGNFTLKSPTTVPDVVTDGYTYARYFNEAWSAYYDYSQTPQNINKTLKFSQEYLEELKRRSETPGLPEVEIGPNGEYVYYGNTDWYKELYKKSTFATDHNISISGSSGKTSFYVTGRYFGQDGLFRYNTDDYQLFNMRAKGAVQVFDWLKIEDNMEYSSMNYHNPLNVGEGGGIWRNIADEGHILAPMFNPDGTLTHSAAYTVGDMWYGKNGIDTDQRVLKNTVSATASFLKNRLRIKGDFTFQNHDNDQTRIRVPVPFSRRPGVIEYVGSSKNDIQNTNKTTTYLASNIYGEFEETFKEKHYFKAMLGYNYEQSRMKNVKVLRNGLIFDDAEDLNMALGQTINTEGGYSKWRLSGGFFRLNYVFDNRYLIEVNGRLDGSSKFPSDSQYAFFPSVSAGWRASQESFWKLPETIFSDLKIRASYGSLGNGNIDPYSFQELFKIKQSDRVLNGIRPQYTGQPAVIPLGLTWEKSTTLNLGLDMSFLSNRLRFSGDVYQRKTTDMFTVGMSLPAVFGTDVPKGNYADLTTKGFELSLTWQDQFQLAGKPLNYEVRFTLADYQSTIDKYNNPEKKLGDDYYYEGMKVGEIWGYETEGFFTSADDIASHAKQPYFYAGATAGQWLPGDIKFKDLNNDKVIDYGNNTVDNPGDQRIIGNSEPRFIYGFNLSGDWNNFFVSAFFQGVGKQDWWPGSEASYFWGMYNRPYNDMPKSHLGNIWSEEKPNTYFPRLRGYASEEPYAELNLKQTRYLQNIAYIRMKNIQVGYILPQRWISKIRMQNAKIYLSGENLWSWSPLYKHSKDLDVEAVRGSDRDLTEGTSGNGYNYPILKSVSLGLSVTF